MSIMLPMPHDEMVGDRGVAVAGLTIDHVVAAADDLDCDAAYGVATGILSASFAVVATTRDEAAAVAGRRIAGMSLSHPVASMTVQACRPNSPKSRTGRHVEELAPGMSGSWLVITQGSTHVGSRLHDLHANTRFGQPLWSVRIRSAAPRRLWPRVGFPSLVRYDDPADPDRTECDVQRRSARSCADGSRALPNPRLCQIIRQLLHRNTLSNKLSRHMWFGVEQSADDVQSEWHAPRLADSHARQASTRLPNR